MKNTSTRRPVFRRPIMAAALWVVLCVAATALAACGASRRQAPAVAKTSSVECELWVTRDYGNAVIKRVTAQLGGKDSVMEVLKRHCRVETDYGGGFVKSVDGLASTRGRPGSGGDWFYYVNGVLAGRGALETAAPPGGVVWWDYHAWSYSGGQFLAVVGAWPRPFTGKCSILYTVGGAKAARAIASALAGATVTVSEYRGGPLSERSTPSMIVGLAGELLEAEWVAGLFRNAWRAGMPGTIRAPGPDGGVVGLDAAGKEASRWDEGSALIVAAASYMGDENPLWVVVGWDEKGLDRAAEALSRALHGETPLRNAFAVAVTPGGIERLPLGPGGGGAGR